MVKGSKGGEDREEVGKNEELLKSKRWGNESEKKRKNWKTGGRR